MKDVNSEECARTHAHMYNHTASAHRSAFLYVFIWDVWEEVVCGCVWAPERERQRERDS